MWWSALIAAWWRWQASRCAAAGLFFHDVVGFREVWRKNRLAPVVVGYTLRTSVTGEVFGMYSQFMAVLLIFAGIGHAVGRQSAQQSQRAPREVPRLYGAN